MCDLQTTLFEQTEIRLVGLGIGILLLVPFQNHRIIQTRCLNLLCVTLALITNRARAHGFLLFALHFNINVKYSIQYARYADYRFRYIVKRRRFTGKNFAKYLYMQI